MSTVGEKKQEEKLLEFAKMAKKLFPGVNELAVKGAFRLGAKAAVEKSRFSNWGEIAKQPASVRRGFFDTLLLEARPHLELALGKGNLDNFLRKIKAENEIYLRSPS